MRAEVRATPLERVGDSRQIWRSTLCQSRAEIAKQGGRIFEENLDQLREQAGAAIGIKLPESVQSRRIDKLRGICRSGGGGLLHKGHLATSHQVSVDRRLHILRLHWFGNVIIHSR